MLSRNRDNKPIRKVGSDTINLPKKSGGDYNPPFVRKNMVETREIVSFKTRVRNCAINNAKLFNDNFVKYDYLICSNAFKNKYFEIKATEGNYLHLVGVATHLSAKTFFKKCLDGTLQENDFTFNKPGVAESALKGTVREKIKTLPFIMTMFKNDLVAQEGFKKNLVSAGFATSDSKNFTFCFIGSGNPVSLLKGYKLDNSKTFKVDLVYRKKTGSKERYKTLIVGNIEKEKQYYNFISNKIEREL